MEYQSSAGQKSLEVLEVPDPEPGPDEVRIRAPPTATVNPTDIGLRAGNRAEAFAAFTPPYVPGMELAGTVDRVGEGAPAWSVGDEVMAIVQPQRTGRGAQSEPLRRPSRAGCSDSGGRVLRRGSHDPHERG